jgi:hypothetical protein
VIEFSGQLVIEQPSADVLDFVADERNRYDGRIRHGEILTDWPVSAGPGWRLESESMGSRVETIVAITGYAPLRKLITTSRADGMEIDSTLAFLGRWREPAGWSVNGSATLATRS